MTTFALGVRDPLAQLLLDIWATKRNALDLIAFVKDPANAVYISPNIGTAIFGNSGALATLRYSVSASLLMPSGIGMVQQDGEFVKYVVSLLTVLGAGDSAPVSTPTYGATIVAADATFTTLTAGVTHLGATTAGTINAGATVVAALTANATQVSTLGVSGATILGGLTAGATSVAALTATGTTTLTSLTAGATTVASIAATDAGFTTLTAGVTHLGATTAATLQAGATVVAALAANATQVTTLGVSGAATITGAATVGGALAVGGNLTKSTGSFVIDHPDQQKRVLGYKLKHCFVESPTRGDNLYRFQVVTKNCSGVISLPDYFAHLNENVQAWVSAVDVLGYGRCTVSDDLKTAEVEVSKDGTYNVLLMGTRSDDVARQFFEGTGGVEYIPQ